MTGRILTEAEIRKIGIKSEVEIMALRVALVVADVYGHGNVMGFLATQWALRLRESGLDEKTAIAHASSCLPYALPNNDDLDIRNE